MANPPRVPLTADDYLELVETAIVALDDAGRVTRVNRKACEILGLPAGEILGRDWFERFIPARLRRALHDVYRRLIAGDLDTLEHYENPVLRADGEERLIAWHNTVIRDAGGRAIGTVSSGQDVTEARRVERELHRSHRELEDFKYALDQAAIVAVTDHRGVIRYANDKFCEISRYSREELLGQDHRLLNSGHHSKEFMRDLWRTIGGGRVWRGEIRNRAKDGRLYWVDTTIVPFLDERGRPHRYLAIRSEITDRKEAEDELRRSEALARVGQMAAVVAHEVKNPLAGIAGAIQVVDGRLPEGSPDHEVFATILRRIDALNERVQDLLLFARPRRPNIARLRLAPILRSTVDLVSRDPRFGDTRVTIDGEDIELEADGKLLQDVVFNLLLNAVQATDGSGQLALDCALNGPRCAIRIRDDGPGIPTELLDRVFEPFFTTKSQGTGLGLAIARQVVEAHGGRVRLDCPREGGTVAEVILPLRHPSADSAGGSDPPAGARAS